MNIKNSDRFNKYNFIYEYTRTKKQTNIAIMRTSIPIQASCCENISDEKTKYGKKNQIEDDALISELVTVGYN